MKSILVFSHVHNSFDKKILLQTPSPVVKESPKTPGDFVTEKEILKFFMHDIDELLEAYDPGKPEHKPDVLKQIEEIKQHREDQIKQMQLQQLQQQQMQQQQQMNVQQVQQLLQNYDNKVRELMEENAKLKEKNQYLDKKITELIQAAIKQNKKI
jgi:septal ring factor EnvC (AmiA/AmiB activator)